jgi:aerobic-type carbon monoxide dehydrogenase small subunit (CoxS/CutS family)
VKEDKKKERGEISRRDFLVGAGAVVVGGAIGAGITYPLVAGKGEAETVTTIKTVSLPTTITTSVAAPTVTTTETVGGETVTTTAPGVTKTVTTTPSGEAIPGLITFNVNGKDYPVRVEPYWTLAYVLKEKIGLPGLKIGCDTGECGTCAVMVDGKSVFSCMMLAIEAEGKEILTIEGLSDNITLDPVQQAFVDNDAVQCGYCVPGFIMAAKALLDENPNPTFDEVREGLSGHICPCGNSKRMVEAVLAVKGGG